MDVDIVTGLAVASLLAAAVCIAVVPAVHRATRGSPGHVRALATGALVAAALWALAHALTLTALAASGTWAVIGIAVGARLVACWFALAYREYSRQRQVSRRAIALLAVEPTVTALGVLSGSEWFVAGRRLFFRVSETLVVIESGVGLSLHALYTVGLGIAGVALLAREAQNGGPRTRRRAGLLTIAVVVPGIAWSVWLLGFPGPLTYDYTPVSLGVSAICIHVATRRYGLFGPPSAAREAVFDDLRNELNVVMGHADALAESEPEPIASKGTTIRRAAVRPAELGERVRGVDRTLRDADHGGRCTSTRSSSRSPNSRPDSIRTRR